MIRRAFWLVVGAAGGIMGYRRAASAARQVAETLGARPKKPGAARRHWARKTIRFARDVHEGMDLYFDRQAVKRASTLGAGADSRRSPSPPSAEDLAGLEARASAANRTKPDENETR